MTRAARARSGGIRLRISLVLVALLVLPFMPSASSSHLGCAPPTTTPTQTIDTGAGVIVYVVVRGTHMWGFSESNEIPGLQETSGCGHLRDSQFAEACATVSTRIPGTVLCIIETAS